MGDTPEFGYTAIVSMGVWQPGARLIGAYSDDDNYFYVEGANAQDSAANAGATSMRLVRRLAGVETVIGKRLMFTSPGEVTGSLGISWGPYGVRTAGLCPGFPFGSGPYYRGDPGPGLLAGVGTGTITGTALFYGFGLGKALSLFQYSNIYNLCTGFPECTPCSLVDGSTCGELTCTLSGLGTWSQVWGPSADFSPVAGTYVVQRVDDYPPPVGVRQGLRGPARGVFLGIPLQPSQSRLTDSANQTIQVLGFRISLSVQNVAPYTVSVVLGVTLEVTWPPQWNGFPPYGFSGPLVPGQNSIALIALVRLLEALRRLDPHRPRNLRCLLQLLIAFLTTPATSARSAAGPGVARGRSHGETAERRRRRPRYEPDPAFTARIDARMSACRACPEFRTDNSQAATHRAFMWCHALDERPGQPRDCSAGRTARFQVRVLREPAECEPWRKAAVGN